MKKAIVISIFTLIAFEFSCNKGPGPHTSNCYWPDSISSKYILDVNVMAITTFRDSGHIDQEPIPIPSVYVSNISNGFASIYGLNSKESDTVFNILQINIPLCDGNLTDVDLSANLQLPWIKRWVQGNLPVNFGPLDELINTYHITIFDTNDLSLTNFFVIRTAGFINTML